MTVANEEPPRRFIAGADSIASTEQKVAAQSVTSSSVLRRDLPAR